MASTGYHDTGEEWAQKTLYRQDLIVSRNASLDVLLYDDSADALTDSDDLGAITTEPTSGNYGRQSFSLDAADVSLSLSGGDTRATATVTFDVSNTTETIDAYALVVDLQSDVVNSESSQNPHLLASATLDGGAIDLSTTASVDLEVRVDQN